MRDLRLLKIGAVILTMINIVIGINIVISLLAFDFSGDSKIYRLIVIATGGGIQCVLIYCLLKKNSFINGLCLLFGVIIFVICIYVIIDFIPISFCAEAFLILYIAVVELYNNRSE